MIHWVIKSTLCSVTNTLTANDLTVEHSTTNAVDVSAPATGGGGCSDAGAGQAAGNKMNW
jgi:hypothetical protein